ncbi:uncharacterized protein LOC114801693 [Denticeps clupeoides]|uniref:Uncharacterized protein n=1 Tax=Denticeps clupeoides TaxID=299321 RepID=A0A8C4A3Z9_9TELE|nr:uncharacterized protein LOC114771722 [Denticeps clupeoides]XP_028855739.1 uncharacterized protein LOC114801693 [Denticeps clupeoides]
MGCRCCRMIKSYIYDPSVPVDVHGHKQDGTTSSLYHPHHHSGDADLLQKKQGFTNQAYASSRDSSDGNSKLHIDNNRINSQHGAQLKKNAGGGGDSGVYILHPNETPTLKCAPSAPSSPPTCQVSDLLTTSAPSDKPPDGTYLHTGPDGVDCRVSEDEEESGVGSTPEYLGDTGDEESVLSGDIHTSSTSLSSGETRPAGLEDPRVMDKRVTKRKEEEDGEDCQSITDSMVAEALAALEAATAGEEYE